MLDHVRHLLELYEKYSRETLHHFDPGMQETRSWKRLTKMMRMYKGSFSYDMNKRLRGEPLTQIDPEQKTYQRRLQQNPDTREKILSDYAKYIDRFVKNFDKIFVTGEQFVTRRW